MTYRTFQRCLLHLEALSKTGYLEGHIRQGTGTAEEP